MRIGHLAAAASAALLLLSASLPATAGDPPSGHGKAHHAGGVVIGIWPGGPDPYQYRSRPVGYYPYYNSDYWRTRAEMRYRYRKPQLLTGEYWSSWGYPVRCTSRACRTQAAGRHPSK